MSSLDLLRDDNHYYGAEGKKYLSNSDIGILLKNPLMYGKQRDKTPEMLKGSYFHTLMLEPEKIDTFVVIDASTRSTKKYKEESGDQLCLLSSEVEELISMGEAMKSNMEVFEYVYFGATGFEVPAIGELFGTMWKGKADIVKSTMIVDIKTTSDIDKFRYSANAYNYDSQAWIYNQLFGVPMVFVVIEKGSNRIGIFDCSDEFLDRGREKVKSAVEVWKKFFGPDATEDINQFVTHLTL